MASSKVTTEILLDVSPGAKLIEPDANSYSELTAAVPAKVTYSKLIGFSEAASMVKLIGTSSPSVTLAVTGAMVRLGSSSLSLMTKRELVTPPKRASTGLTNVKATLSANSSTASSVVVSVTAVLLALAGMVKVRTSGTP